MPQQSSSSSTLDERALAKLLARLPHDQLVEMAGSLDDIALAKDNLGPQTKEEFWWTFKERYGIELSRVAVCEGHSCQLDMAWEVYSFAVQRVLWVVDRGGGKTSTVAWMDDCQSNYYPGFENFTIGPGKSQGERKYAHILPHVVEGGIIGNKELDHVARSTVTKTEYKNGSAIEIALGGTPAQANGPRVPRLHRDEIELLDSVTRKQAGNIPAGRMSRDGRYMPSQIIDTSTMKWAGGYVDKAIEEYNDAIEKGVRPRQEVRISCVFESTAENPTCRSAPDHLRRARLIELERDPEELCDCDTWVSGNMPTEDPDAEPEPRTLEKVCQGRFFRSRGYKQFDDVTSSFLENDPETWDAEKECSQPAREGAYIKSYSQLRHGIRGYGPDPLNGPIDTSTDWGGTDHHSHGWYQTLEREVRAISYKSGLIRSLPIGSVVRFAEIFKEGIGDVELGQMVIEMESQWMLKYPGWQVRERYCDIANRSGRLNWRDQLGLNPFSRVNKDFKQEVKLVRSRGGGRFFYVDIKACPSFDRAIRAWRQVNGVEVHDEASHPMAEFRYYESNHQVHERQVKRKQRADAQQASPIEVEVDEDRADERHVELAGRVIVTRHGTAAEEEIFEVGGAADSPMSEMRSGDRVLGHRPRSELRRMGNW